jgi:hypothetical protein
MMALGSSLLFKLSCVFLLLAPWSSGKEAPGAGVDDPQWDYQEFELLGWRLHIRKELRESEPEKLEKALEILQKQLEEIASVLPGPAVEKLRRIPLWLSPVYPGEQPRCEYHPGAGWLKEHGRDPAMAKGIEFSNIGIFEAEYRRMPNFALHELAHAYHDQFLDQGFSNPQVAEAYRKSKDSGKYEQVEQRFGDGRSTNTRAYAMSNPAEYFAESTEAYYSTNDFFPFTREQLEKHDPQMAELVGKLWSPKQP